PRRYFELVETLGEVLHQRVEILAPDAHAGMHRLHVAAGIDAGAAGSLADLLDQARLEPVDTGVSEEFVDALVGRDVLHEVLDHRRNGGVAAKPIIERSRLTEGAVPRERKCEQRDGGGEWGSLLRPSGPPTCDRLQPVRAAAA